MEGEGAYLKKNIEVNARDEKNARHHKVGEMQPIPRAVVDDWENR